MSAAAALARVEVDKRAEGGAAVNVASRRVRDTQWFAEPVGFGLRTYASGRRVWIAQARMGGRTRTITLGNAVLLSEHEARLLARRVLLRAYGGDNPAEERKRVRQAPSFARFLDEYWQRCSGRWKASTQETHGIYRRGYLDDAFAGQFVDAISEADVTRWFVRVTDRAGPGGANRAMEILSAIFVRAEAWGYRPDGTNPCRGVRRNRRRKCERFLSEDELARLGTVLKDEAERHPVHAAAVQLLLLTGCRVSEVLGLDWGDIRGHRIQLRDGKTGPRTVWIGADARAQLQAIERHPGRSHVFHSAHTGKRLGSLCHYWHGVRAAAGLGDVRLHDLRHTFASHAARASETLPMIAKLLGHRDVRSAARYAHLDDATVLEANQVVGDAIARMMGE